VLPQFNTLMPGPDACTQLGAEARQTLATAAPNVMILVITLVLDVLFFVIFGCVFVRVVGSMIIRHE